MSSNALNTDYIMKISEVVQQNNAPWGISRVSTGSVSLAGLDPLSLDFPYFADDSAGSGTDVYVLDTGVLTTHDEFEGRATFLATFGPGVPGQDVNGREYDSLNFMSPRFSACHSFYFYFSLSKMLAEKTENHPAHLPITVGC